MGERVPQHGPRPEERESDTERLQRDIEALLAYRVDHKRDLIDIPRKEETKEQRAARMAEDVRNEAANFALQMYRLTGDPIHFGRAKQTVDQVVEGEEIKHRQVVDRSIVMRFKLLCLEAPAETVIALHRRLALPEKEAKKLMLHVVRTVLFQYPGEEERIQAYEIYCVEEKFIHPNRITRLKQEAVQKAERDKERPLQTAFTQGLVYVHGLIDNGQREEATLLFEVMEISDADRLEQVNRKGKKYLGLQDGEIRYVARDERERYELQSTEELIDEIIRRIDDAVSDEGLILIMEMLNRRDDADSRRLGQVYTRLMSRLAERVASEAVFDKNTGKNSPSYLRLRERIKTLKNCGVQDVVILVNVWLKQLDIIAKVRNKKGEGEKRNKLRETVQTSVEQASDADMLQFNEALTHARGEMVYLNQRPDLRIIIARLALLQVDLNDRLGNEGVIKTLLHNARQSCDIAQQHAQDLEDVGLKEVFSTERVRHEGKELLSSVNSWFDYFSTDRTLNEDAIPDNFYGGEIDREASALRQELKNLSAEGNDQDWGAWDEKANRALEESARDLGLLIHIFWGKLYQGQYDVLPLILNDIVGQIPQK